MDDMETKTVEIGAEAEEQRILETEEITEEVIRAVVNRIVRALNPEKVIVFGSAVTGDPAKAHDLDVLVVMESDEPRDKREIAVDMLLWGRLFDLDTFVLTPKELHESIKAQNQFLKTILATGRIMYERKSA